MEIALIIFHLLFFVTSFSASYLFMMDYPKKINNVIGHRTKRSMASQQAWLLANRYSSRLLFNCSLGCIALQILSIALFGLLFGMVITLVFWLLSLVSVMFFTERMLKAAAHNQDK